MREGNNKESSLTGLGAVTIKQPFLNEIRKFENRMIGKLPEDSELYRKNLELSQPAKKADQRQKAVIQALRWLSVPFGLCFRRLF